MQLGTTLQPQHVSYGLGPPNQRLHTKNMNPPKPTQGFTGQIGKKKNTNPPPPKKKKPGRATDPPKDGGAPDLPQLPQRGLRGLRVQPRAPQTLRKGRGDLPGNFLRLVPGLERKDGLIEWKTLYIYFYTYYIYVIYVYLHVPIYIYIQVCILHRS